MMIEDFRLQTKLRVQHGRLHSEISNLKSTDLS